jgi:hypothetical protein
MIELQDAADFAAEAIAKLRVSRENVGQDLDGDDTIQPRVAGFVDLAHTARTERGKDFVRAETTAGGECHGKWLGL